MIDEAATVLGVEPNEVVNRAFGDEESLELLAEALFAASHTLNVQKVNALAIAVANGLGDDRARVDHERLVVAALADLEAPHIRLLLLMARGRRSKSFEGWARLGSGGPGQIHLLMTALQRHALVQSNEAEQNEAVAAWLVDAVNHQTAGLSARIRAQEQRSGSARHRIPSRRFTQDPPDMTIKWYATGFGVACARYLLNHDVQAIERLPGEVSADAAGEGNS